MFINRFSYVFDIIYLRNVTDNLIGRNNKSKRNKETFR